MQLKDITKLERLESCLAIATGFLALFFIFKVKAFLIVSLVIGLIGMFIPFIATRVTWLWYKLAHGLGYINSKILLTLIFFIFLVPIALLSRIFTKNKTLQLKRKENKDESYFIDRDHQYTAKDLEKMW